LSGRLAPPMHGMGLLDSISEATILENSDPLDMNKDGISGRPNYVFSHSLQRDEIGRFGWKANEPTLHDQDAAAFNGDMGLTTTLFPGENCGTDQSVCKDLPNGGEPEVTDKQLNLMVHYSKFVAVPARRNSELPDVIKGRELFIEANCQSCHRPTMTTRDDASHKLLSGQKIWPYTDLLIHDMGDELADNRPDGLANGSEWRTSPLWGIGLTAAVNGHEFYMHDGRARTLEEAILWHGGEAEASRETFKGMTAENRAALLEFLKSL
ncbi:MAG: c-type cytochrome, partial [Pseudomonas sp.]